MSVAVKLLRRGPPTTELLQVVNRGVTYDPPRSHLGKDIGEVSALDAGKLALEFFDKMLGEAEALANKA